MFRVWCVHCERSFENNSHIFFGCLRVKYEMRRNYEVLFMTRLIRLMILWCYSFNFLILLCNKIVECYFLGWWKWHLVVLGCQHNWDVKVVVWCFCTLIFLILFLKKSFHVCCDSLAYLEADKRQTQEQCWYPLRMWQ